MCNPCAIHVDLQKVHISGVAMPKWVYDILHLCWFRCADSPVTPGDLVELPGVVQELIFEALSVDLDIRNESDQPKIQKSC